MTDPCDLPAVEALGLFRARSLSPVELMQAVIARAEAVEPVVNALCHRFFDEALEQARAAESRYCGRGEPPRALEGIPVAVKEEEPIAGQPLTQGSLIHRDTIAGETTPFAQRMLHAGAIVHARSTAPEFSVAGFTRSRLWGATRNPWNPEYSPGGSSGGSAAALACGTATLASGSDIGGSIRIPASFCGVVGFKPPYGRVPVEPPFNLDAYCHCGPLARTVADCALYENVLAGPEPTDVVTLRPKLVLPATLDGVEGLRVALSVDLGDWPVDPEVRANTLRAAEALRAAGATVEEADLTIPRGEVMRAAAIHFRAVFGAWLAQECAEHPDEVTAYSKDFVRWCEETAGGASFLDGLELETRLYTPLGALLERCDALLCPTNGTRGLLADEEYVDTRLTVGGETVGYYEEGLMTVPFNVLSRCPALSVPSGLADNGVPTGVQIVGRSYDDLTVFRLGAALERELGLGEARAAPPICRSLP